MAKKVLLIDDEELITKSLTKLLEIEGYKVTIANSGRQALEKFQEEDFDLIICDVKMPDTDGIETIKLMRSHSKKPTPEVVITGYADADRYEAALDLKVAGHLYKPFDNLEFLQVIKKAIGEY